MSLIRIPAFTALDAIALNITLTTAVRTNPQQLLHCVRGEPNLVPFAWPLDEQQARVNVEELAAYHATHRFRYPGCLCPILYPEAIGTDNETVLFLASHGEYEGRLVVACARGDCGYLVDLYSFYVQPEHLAQRYPRRGVIVAGGLTYVADNSVRGDFACFLVRRERQGVHQVEIDNYKDVLPLLHVLHAPQINEPQTTSNMLYRLISMHRPGLTERAFANLIGHCEICGLVATRRKLGLHKERCGQHVMTDLTADDVRRLDNGAFIKLLYQLDNGGPGLTPEVTTQMFARCCCGLVVATRKFNLHECRENDAPPSYE